MKRTTTALLLLLAACQRPDSQEEAPAPVEGGVFAEAQPWCPEGTVQKGQPPPHGQEVSCALPDGSLHGRTTRWFDNGYIAEDGHHEQGQRQGLWTTQWRRSGRIQSQGQYAAGKKEGVWRFFDKRGRIKEEAIYKEDVLVEMKKLSHNP